MRDLKALDTWLEGDKHSFNCFACSEGQLCCVDKGHPSRDIIVGLIGKKTTVTKDKEYVKVIEFSQPLIVGRAKVHGIGFDSETLMPSFRLTIVGGSE